MWQCQGDDDEWVPYEDLDIECKAKVCCFY